jgi:serine/threonine protein phosphatase PrpC
MILCDGMGGIGAGDVASRVTVETVKGCLKPKQGPMMEIEARMRMRDALQLANKKLALENSRIGIDSSTTISAADLFVDKQTGKKKLVTGQLGDSSICVIRKGELIPVTREDSFYTGFEQQFGIKIDDQNPDNMGKNFKDYLIEKGVPIDQRLENLFNATRTRNKDGSKITYGETTIGQLRNVNTAGMTGKGEIDPEIKVFDVEDGDMVLALSDGILDSVTRTELKAKILELTAKKLSPKELCAALIDWAIPLQTDEKNKMRNKKDDASAGVMVVTGLTESGKVAPPPIPGSRKTPPPLPNSVRLRSVPPPLPRDVA